MLQRPEDVNECIYFTNREIGDGGAVLAWVFRDPCPECKKANLGKPVDKKGKVKTRSREYVCPECGYSVDKDEYEPTLTLNAAYTCPECGHEAEKQVPYKRKNIKGVPTIRIDCDSCGAHMDLTKKMKDPKK